MSTVANGHTVRVVSSSLHPSSPDSILWASEVTRVRVDLLFAVVAALSDQLTPPASMRQIM
ncbi:protein of unknown function (plasmid) [Caballeronia sp. S22]